MIDAPVTHEAPETPPTQFELVGEPRIYDSWQGGIPDLRRSLCANGFWMMPPSSSRQGTLENLSPIWLVLTTPTASRKGIAESLTGLFRADERAASVREADAAENLFELRRLTGLPWKPLANLLNVDRRTLHNWVKGGEVRIANRQHIAKTLSVMRFADRGTAEENVRALMERSSSSVTPFEAIKGGKYLSARQLLSHGQSRPLLAPVSTSWTGEFRPMALHEGADGSEIYEPLPDEPKPVSRKRRIKRG